MAVAPWETEETADLNERRFLLFCSWEQSSHADQNKRVSEKIAVRHKFKHMYLLSDTRVE
jgi:hypothetical protein